MGKMNWALPGNQDPAEAKGCELSQLNDPQGHLDHVFIIQVKRHGDKGGETVFLHTPRNVGGGGIRKTEVLCVLETL